MAKFLIRTVTYYSFYCPGCKHQHTYTICLDGTGWDFSGTLDNPSFKPSLLNELPVVNEVVDKETGKIIRTVEMKERCHLFITNGKICYCSDCYHEFAGQTIDIPDLK